MIMDTLERIRVFHLVADNTSFVEASRRLGISAVAASRAVAALEDELGIQLLRRTTRSVRLTEPGAEYLARTRRVLSDLDDAGRAVRGEDAEPRGQLVVTAPVMFGRLHVMPVIAAMLRKHPKLAVRLTLMDRRVRLVEEGIDVAVRIGDLADSALRALPLASVKRVLVAAPKYLARKGAPRKPADLAHHDLIAFDAFTPNSEWRVGGKSVSVAPRLWTNSVEATIDAAIQGLGIARLTSYQVARQIRERKLVTVLDDVSDETLPVSLVYHADRQQSANVKAFIAALRQALPGCPAL